MADYQLQSSKFYKKIGFSSTGVIEPTAGHELRGEGTLTVTTENVNDGNLIVVQAKLKGAESWIDIADINGAITNTEIKILGYDLIRFNVTSYSSSGNATLIASAFFANRLGSIQSTGNTTTLQTWVSENARGNLSKIYNEISGTILVASYYAYESTQPGENCLKITYKYTSSTLKGQKSSLSEWTQAMQDELDALDSGFSNNQSLSFNGIDQYVNFGNVHNYDIATSFSVSMWIKPQNLSARRALFSKTTNDSSVHGVVMYQETGGPVFLQARAPGYLRSHTFSGENLSSSVWNHVVLTYSGNSNLSGFKVYINGSLAGTGSSLSIGASWLSSQDFTVGSRNSSFHFSGNIDEVTIWDLELSSSAVSELYNSGNPNNPESISAVNNLQSYYKMGDFDNIPLINDNIGSNNGTTINMDSSDIEVDTP